jgi:hypothetical protein
MGDIMMRDDEKKTPKTAEEQGAPAPERPVDAQDAAIQQGEPQDRPSQAEGERDEEK